MLRRQLERYGRWLFAIGGLVVLATVSTVYVLREQNVVTPFADRYSVRAELENTSGLEPGLGQPVNVAGVRVGTITHARLRDGRSLVTLQIDPGDLPAVYKDARATLVPNSPLDDLQIELHPGTRAAGRLAEGAVIPVVRTASPADLDELLAVLDSDNRAFLQALIAGAGEGTRGRGADVRELLRALRPTARQLGDVTRAVAARRDELRRAVHNLARVTRAAAHKDDELADVVAGAASTVRAVAGQEGALRIAVARLPRTLRAADTVLRDRAFTTRLRPTLDALLPVARSLAPALRAVRPLAVQGPPLVRSQLRPLAREAQPLVRALSPATASLNAVTPSLTTAFNVLDRLANELGHNPQGAEEGYLFWLAWAVHNLNSSLSTEDANGGVFRGYGMLNCDIVKQQAPYTQTILQAVAILPMCS